jgi:hypothetical protein
MVPEDRVQGKTQRELRAVLFRSRERFDAFREKLAHYGVACTVLDFDGPEWRHFDYRSTDVVIYYPSFEYSSNHPAALGRVLDNLRFLHAQYPRIRFYPDPCLFDYYNDKYRQFLYLSRNGFPIPRTIPLVSHHELDRAEKELGYPMVLKNRHGAGGGSVFRVHSRKELEQYYRVSTLDLFSGGGLRHFAGLLSKRVFYYHLVKGRQAVYPFLTPPLLAQEFITIDRDLKTVVGRGEVVEGHWRLEASSGMWKVNIDAGGIGMWSEIPREALELSVHLARALRARWINIDLMAREGQFLISEFSPVWHHYAYREKPSFVYKEDYNLETPLEISLDLERIIVESLVSECREIAEADLGADQRIGEGG